MSKVTSILTPLVAPSMGNRSKDWRSIKKEIKELGGIQGKYWYRLALINLITSISGPFQRYEDKKWEDRIKNTPLHEEPVFIIGHWRSGTTHLHNLLSLDDQFGVVTTQQALFPHSYLTNSIFPGLTQFLMPPTRPFDSMKIYQNSPQEEEMAMVNYGKHSFYNFWHTPDRMKDWYLRTVRFDQFPEYEAGWLSAYGDLLQKSNAVFEGRRLLLKNPPNTGRIPSILKMFPKAKFIFIHRDPYSIYPSTQKLHKGVIPMFNLQDYDFEITKKTILFIYKDMLEYYLKTRSLIPQKNLMEVRYQDLLENPVDELASIYSKMDLGDFTKMKPIFDDYLSDKRGHKPAVYDTPEVELEQLRKDWQFSFDEWGYNV